jgi:phage gp45-like
MSVPADSNLTRATVTNVKMGQRTFIQINGLDGVTQNWVELLLPPGYTAHPVVGADVALFQVMGSSDHVIALGGDMLGNAVADLAPGEFGFSDGSNMVLFQGGYLKLISPTKVRVQAPLLECTGQITANCDGAFTTLSQHVHPAIDTPPTPGT